MTQRRTLIAGNWKMNSGTQAGRDLATAIADGASKLTDCDLVVAPPYTLLSSIVDDLRQSRVGVAAQNMHQAPNGAFTGEISAEMLKATGCAWVILGHSERRQYFAETDEQVAQKTKAALAAGLRPIVCIGETLEERDAGLTLEVVKRQLDAFVAVLAGSVGVAAVAYEPVWAIGTGKVATPEQAQDVHAAIRAHIAEASDPLAQATRLLYGGSVKPSNARELLACADIDGALVGGASLQAADFLAIAENAQ